MASSRILKTTSKKGSEAKEHCFAVKISDDPRGD